MSDWWEKGYPGGAMVPVAGFPRSLYPPDSAPGHKPSSDGPDVIAYKRTISRAGRWPWGTFDDTYSNDFAHGKSGGHVADSGVAGIQRQQNIEPTTGFIGEKTFNLLRSIRIPQGLPNAGQPAMDANAQTLIAEAFKQFQTPPKGDATVRELALAEAVKHIGLTESPANSNQCLFSSWYGMVGPWCAMFASYCYENSEKGGSPSFAKGSYYSYVPYIVNDANARRRGLSITTSPLPGDLICYDWDGGDYDHVGLYESGNTVDWTAVEGNTSADNNGSQSNGGGVYRRKRSRSQAKRVVFVRVAEP